MTQKRNKSGFTLIELLVVIAIIGVLSSVVLQSLNSARTKARNAERLTSIDQINKAFELGATGGTNVLPFSNNTYACLGLAGLTGDVCTNTSSLNNTLSNNIALNMAGGVIPKDPTLISGIGFRYLYNSSIAPNIGSFTGTNSCTAAICPSGAYLSWVVEGSTNCGRGHGWNTHAVTGSTQCVLRIGNAVTN